MKHYLRKDEV